MFVRSMKSTLPRLYCSNGSSVLTEKRDIGVSGSLGRIFLLLDTKVQDVASWQPSELDIERVIIPSGLTGGCDMPNRAEPVRPYSGWKDRFISIL